MEKRVIRGRVMVILWFSVVAHLAQYARASRDATDWAEYMRDHFTNVADH